MKRRSCTIELAGTTGTVRRQCTISFYGAAAMHWVMDKMLVQANCACGRGSKPTVPVGSKPTVPVGGHTVRSKPILHKWSCTQVGLKPAMVPRWLWLQSDSYNYCP